MKILTIVVTYNATNWIDNCFASLINSTLSTEIFVVDNNSSDNTVELIKKNYSQVNVYEAGENLGFGKANNLGFKMALDQKYDYVFLLNQDAWIEEQTIEKLINSYSKNSEFGIVVPLQMNGAGNLIDSQFMTYTISNNRKLATDVFSGNSDGLHQVDFANAACWLIPISVIVKIGGFDPLFPHYGEDNDYINRVKKHNLNIGLNLSTRVFHDRELRAPKTKTAEIVNEIFIRELVDLKSAEKMDQPITYFIRNSAKATFKYFASGFDFYYLIKIKAYFQILKIFETIKSHKEQEKQIFHHYL